MCARIDSPAANENQVCLQFGLKIGITIESSFEYAIRDRRSYVQAPPEKTSWLMEFLGLSVTAVTGARDGTLTLRFGKDSWLARYDPTLQYEAYRTRNGDKEIIV